jgi:hypothetical protein
VRSGCCQAHINHLKFKGGSQVPWWHTPVVPDTWRVMWEGHFSPLSPNQTGQHREASTQKSKNTKPWKVEMGNVSNGCVEGDQISWKTESSKSSRATVAVSGVNFLELQVPRDRKQYQECLAQRHSYVGLTYFLKLLCL